jgi:quercetin dioxygenase-like cupin family protein
VGQSLAAIANTPALLAAASHDGPIWSSSGEQLNVNLVRLSGGAGIEAHINAELDVTIVVVQGEGLLTLDREERRVQAGDIVMIPRGVRRAIASAGGVFAYVTCHRRRAALMPS